jgi:glycosyltransferase involved in cell wall biosynthesis
MAEKILTIISNPAMLKKMSLYARMEALEYSHDYVTQEIERLYNQIINQHKENG